MNLNKCLGLYHLKTDLYLFSQVKSVGEGCKSMGNDKCLLDFESATNHVVVVMVTDNGKPPMEKEFTLTIDVEDVNDPPYNLAIKMENLPEDLPTGSKVATMIVSNEINYKTKYF